LTFIGEGSKRGFGGDFRSPALPVVTNALPRPGLAEWKLTVPTFLMREDLIIGSNFCQGRIERNAECRMQNEHRAARRNQKMLD
jgi:hypothetical protein